VSEKRRDKKGRILRTNEAQRADGRYMYTYKAPNGKNEYVYSWRLEPTDKTPAGKKHDLSLREKEKQILKDLNDIVAYHGGEFTVFELTEKYVNQRRGVRPTTRAGYRTVLGILKKSEFGSRRIDTVRISDAKEFFIKLHDEGRSYSSIHSVRGVIRPAFQLAVDDDLIRKNPFNFPLASVVVNDSVTRDAISKKDEKRFMEFIKDDDYYRQYYEVVYILFNTGMRISEFCGLTLRDIDLKKRTINIDHQLQTTSRAGVYIEKTKTNAGTRVLPMSNGVYECFKKLVENRRKPKVEPMIDGYAGFLCLDKNDKPLLAYHWEKRFQHIREKYNSIYKLQLPEITPHVCRHTYCSNMARARMSPKTLQYLMGHSDISVTLNTYTHFGLEDAQGEVSRLDEAGNE